MSDWENFPNFDNFELAWERIQRSNHYYNKDWIGLRVYGANLKPNLEYLMDRVGEDIYKPSASDKLYIPKVSGTLRSFPFLCIDDRIIYQAIANIVVKKSWNLFEAITR